MAPSTPTVRCTYRYCSHSLYTSSLRASRIPERNHPTKGKTEELKLFKVHIPRRSETVSLLTQEMERVTKAFPETETYYKDSAGQ